MTHAARFLLPGILMLGVAGAALADPPTPSPTPAPAAPEATTVSPANVKPNPADKVICKYEIPSGSRLGGHRTCMKKSDWDAQAAATQAVMSQRIGSGTNSH